MQRGSARGGAMARDDLGSPCLWDSKGGGVSLKRMPVNTAVPPASGEGTSTSAPQAVAWELPKVPLPESRVSCTRSHSPRAAPNFFHPDAPDACTQGLPLPTSCPPRPGKVWRLEPRTHPAGSGAEASGVRENRGRRRRGRGAPRSRPCCPGRRQSWRRGGGGRDVTCCLSHPAA